MDHMYKLAKKSAIGRPAPMWNRKRGLLVPREQTLGRAPSSWRDKTQDLEWSPQKPNAICPTASTRRSVVQRWHYPSGVGSWLG